MEGNMEILCAWRVTENNACGWGDEEVVAKRKAVVMGG
jgi:hypothetical protein